MYYFGDGGGIPNDFGRYRAELRSRDDIMLIRLGRDDEAIDRFNRVLELDLSVSLARVALGLTDLKKGALQRTW